MNESGPTRHVRLSFPGRGRDVEEKPWRWEGEGRGEEYWTCSLFRDETRAI